MPANPSDLENQFSLKNSLLLSAPTIDEGIFHQSIIMLSHHSPEEGAFGIIINHPAETTVDDLLPQFCGTALGSLNVFHGGPVSMDKLTFTAISWSDKSGLDCQFSVSTDAAADLLEGDSVICPAVGHSAWEPGQLESELQRNTWITARAKASIFNHPWDLHLWKKYLNNLSPYHSLLANAPRNPALN